MLAQGAVINSMVVSMHYDSLYWEDEHAFKPERWLDDNGRFTTKKEGFMPFGVGKVLLIYSGYFSLTAS